MRMKTGTLGPSCAGKGETKISVDGSTTKGKAMDLLATAVPVENGIETVDTIEYAGHLWLVPIWADQPGGELTTPARLVCLSFLPHQKTG